MLWHRQADDPTTWRSQLVAEFRTNLDQNGLVRPATIVTHTAEVAAVVARRTVDEVVIDPEQLRVIVGAGAAGDLKSALKTLPYYGMRAGLFML